MRHRHFLLAALSAASLGGCDLPPGGYPAQGGGYGSGPYRPAPSSSYDEDEARPLRITDAVWRADNGRSVDATGYVRGQCDREQECRLRADNRFFGDPAPGRGKRLIIGYRCDRGRLEFVIPENKTETLACRH